MLATQRVLNRRRRTTGGANLTPNQYFTDWREYQTNQRPAGWTFPHDQPRSTAIRVAGYQNTPSGRILSWSDIGGSRDRYSLVYSTWPAYDGTTAVQNQEVYGEFEVVSPTYSNDGVHAFLCGLMTRVSGTGTSERGFRLILHQTIGDGVKHLTLNTYVSGAYTELKTVGFDWQVGTVYSMRFKASGSRLTGSVWVRGTTEPTTPMIDFTLVDPTQIAYTGPPGVQFHEASVVNCYVWGAGLKGDPAPTAYARTPATGTKQRFYSFENETLGTVPSYLTRAFADDAGRFKIVADASVPGGKVLEFTGQAGARSMYGLFLTDVGVVGDVELYTEIFVPTAAAVVNARFGGLIARAGANGTLWTGWGNDSRMQSGTPDFFAESNFDRWVNSASSSTLAGDTGTPLAGALVKNTWTCLRIKVIGNKFYARYWTKGSAEPTTWWVSTDPTNLVPTSSTATGKAGFYTMEDRTIRWRCLGVGVDGMPAPTS